MQLETSEKTKQTHTRQARDIRYNANILLNAHCRYSDYK